MSDLLWIRGGRVVDPVNQRDETGDVFVREGLIAEALSPTERQGAEVIEAKGLVVCPGLVDIHVHLREPGQVHKESIETGSHAAAAGGFTSIVCMPNTKPVCDTAGTIQQILEKASRKAAVHVYPTGCITVGMKGEHLAPIGSLKKAGVVAVTDDGHCVQDNELMRRALEYARMFNLPVLDHCQDYSLTRGAVMHEGEWSIRMGLGGWPSAAEDIIVARNAILSHYTGAHVHLQHISSAYSVDIVRRVKGRGGAISAEATPHHLALTDAALADFDTRFKMNPPLRSEADRQALIKGVAEGVIDCIATDHAPHTDYEKDVEFDHAPFGIIGLETCLPVCLEALVRGGHCSLSNLISMLTFKPARIISLDAGTLLPGRSADITLFDPEAEWTVAEETLQSRSSNSPWLGQRLRGRCVRTIVGGRTVYADGAVTPG